MKTGYSDTFWNFFDDTDSEGSENSEMMRSSRSYTGKFEEIWSNWSGWSDCENRYGESKRLRVCRGSYDQKENCIGSSNEVRSCSEIYCKENDCSKGHFQIFFNKESRTGEICGHDQLCLRTPLSASVK